MTEGPRILVVDDERQILRALKVILREAGYEVAEATSVEEALDVASVRPPDAAIIDLMLPDGSGVDLCRRLREWTQMPILVLSAVGEEDAWLSPTAPETSKAPCSWALSQYRHGDSNPGFRRERAAS